MLERLKNRRQFLRVAAKNRKWVTRGILLQAAPRPAEERMRVPGPRYGLTVSKRVGNSVVRNRARRRLRAAAEEILPLCATPSFDYVLIGRKETPARDFASLKKDLKTGLRNLDALRAEF